MFPKRVLLVLAFSFALYGVLGARGISVRLLEDRADRCKVEFGVDDYTVEEVYIDGKKHSKILVSGGSIWLEEGYPKLPKFARSIIIPDDGIMKFDIVDIEYKIEKVDPVIPSKGSLPRSIDPATVPYSWSDFYQRDEWFPPNIIEIGSPYILRDFRGVTIHFNPFQYNPIKGELKVITRVVVEVYKESPGGENVLMRKRNRISVPFKEVYRNHFLNFGTVRARYPHLSDAVGNMLIITADAYYANMENFVFWKRKKGIPVEIESVSVIGNTQTNIKNYIQNKYDTEGVTWVLLVGNAVDVVPAIGISGWATGAAADPNYVWLAGADHYPDAFISRFSANSAIDVDNQVTRSINYERFPEHGGEWYHKGTGIASNEGTPPDHERADWLRDTLLAYTYTHIDRIYQIDGATTSWIRDSLNLGRSIVNYLGHGSMTSWHNVPFTNSDVHALLNTDMLPFVFSVACVVGAFDAIPECFMEAWVWAGTPCAPTGAIASYGATINQRWIPPTTAQNHAMGLLKRGEASTIGGITFNGAMYMMDVHGPYGLDMYETWHIFGDASISLRTDIPDTFEVTYTPAIPVGQGDFTITVKDNDAITPLWGALVCVWGKIDTAMWMSGYTDASGQISFFINPSHAPDTMWVTVTKHNYLPYEGSVDVILPSGPWMVFNSYTVIDILGDNDSLVDPGETIELPVTIHNVGLDTGYSVTGILRTTDPYVTITDSIEDFGDIAPDSYSTSFDNFDFDVTPACPNNHTLYFDLVTSDINDSTWVSRFSIPVPAPTLKFYAYTIDDDSLGESAGNNDGIVNPGETIELPVSLRNQGPLNAPGVSAILSTNDIYITLIDSIEDFGNIASGDTTICFDDFVFYVDPACPRNHEITFYLNISDTDPATHNWQDSLKITVWDPGDIMIVSKDADYTHYFTTALDSLGFTYDIYTGVSLQFQHAVLTSSAKHSLPVRGTPFQQEALTVMADTSIMKQYPVIIWLTGDLMDGTVTASEQTALEWYLDSGRSLFITGQDIGYDLVHTGDGVSFYQNYLRADYIRDHTGIYTLDGISGDPIGDGLTLWVSGGDGADNQNWLDEIDTLNGSTRVFQYSGGGYGAIKYEGAYRLVYFSFGYEAINNLTDRVMVMERVLAWLAPDNTAPSVPVLISPDSGMAINNIPTFIWHSSTDDMSGVSYYTLQYTTDSSFASLDSVNTVDTTIISPIRLLDTIYYWRVQSIDTAGNRSAWSSIWSFEIDTDMPDIPTLVSPVDGEHLDTLSVVFEWNEVVKGIVGSRQYGGIVGSRQYAVSRDERTVSSRQYAVSRGQCPISNEKLAIQKQSLWERSPDLDYRHQEMPPTFSYHNVQSNIYYILQVDTTPGFTSPIIDTTSLTSNTLILNQGLYYWRVKAFDMAGNEGGFSDISLFVIDTTSPVIDSTTELPDTVGFFGPFTVRTKLTDNFSIKDVVLYFRINNGEWVADTMAGSGNWYEAEIPELTPADAIIIDYYITASDSADNLSRDPEETDYSFSLFLIGIEEIRDIPAKFVLFAPRPNPSVGTVKIEYGLPERADIGLSIYDIQGRLVELVYRGKRDAGYHKLKIDSRDLSSGIYFIRFQTPGSTHIKKLIILR